jgi:hypothetical protein|tara:strand:+ start:563 stop:916 length:354 start_codon:yes stop_codon:yes gene_type:complete
MTYITIGLIFSVILNIVLLWYVSKVLGKLLYTSDNLGDLYVMLRMYESFLKSVYEMEMFYGEPILKELIDRTKIVREEIQIFEEIYGLTTDIEAIEEDLANDDRTDGRTAENKEETT